MQRKSLATLLTCAILSLGALTLSAADVSGKWGWSTPGRNGGEPRKSTLTLKAEGQKLTGKLTQPGRQGAEPAATEITDGKVTGDDIAFTVVREFGGNKMTFKYSGKVEGDTIKGKVETERDGNSRSRDWEAKREK